MKFNKNKWLSIFLLIQIVFVKWIANYPLFIEKYYANGIYKYISKSLRFLFHWLPVSVGDVFYLLVIIWLIIKIYKFFKRKPKKWSQAFFAFTAKLSVVYFVFHLFWGLNYYRQPLHESLALKMPTYNVEELGLLTEKLLIKTQEIHFKITKNDTLPVAMALSTTDLYDIACRGYLSLEKKHKQFQYSQSKVKSSLFSLPLTYMGFSGYLNPFTNEAQVNYKIPNYKIAGTATHEIAHQLGYASESEANFIGFLAATNSDNLILNYSGYIMALRYCLSEIRIGDKDLFDEMMLRIPIGVKKNIIENQEFWGDYENPLEPFFKKFYDLFLKSNNQKKGIKSYGYMVNLLLAYELKNGLD